jgi:hypothetical protein
MKKEKENVYGKGYWAFRYSQSPSWLSGPRPMTGLNPPLIGPGEMFFFSKSMSDFISFISDVH